MTKGQKNVALSLGRRTFLSGVVATALGAAMSPAKSGAQGINQKRLIDVHHHFVTPRFVEELGDAVSVPPGWWIDKSLGAMDRAGVATSMLSLNNPGPWLGDAAKSRTLCRHCNDFAAKAGQDHPGRFGHFASLPLPDIDGSLQEIAYAIDTLRADGFIVHTNEQDKWLGHSDFWPVYEELNRRRATVFVHPITAECCGNTPIAIPSAFLELPFETTRAIANWIYSGSAGRFPDIKFIFSHGGGATPMLLSRFSAVAARDPKLAAFVPHGIVHELKKFHYDTAAIYNATAVAAVLTMVPRGRILFGSDVPYADLETCVEMLGKLIPDAEEQRAIGRDNALALFPRYA
ncbi:amidohydrolase family protein [Rhizobium aegyptiacum]|uniref:amidohydrolase family protein n=1 Tax=Rhizobium aegyptiacum TaxID=1764550 RepID=UPI0007E5B8D3|nr:amidohydrolase family protein [Rhizobium aegyptiacum]